MRWNKNAFALALLALCLSACATVKPPRRISSGIVLPRGVPFDASGKRGAETHHTAAVGFEIDHSTSYNDAGETHEGNAIGFSGELAPHPRIGLGGSLNHYWGSGIENSSGYGLSLFFRWLAIHSEVFHLSLLPNLRFTEISAQDSFCKNISGFVVYTCSSAPLQAKSSIKALELAVNLMFEFYVNESNALAFVPGAHYEKIRANNYLDTYSDDYSLSAHFWTYSAMFYYLYRFGDESRKMLFQVGAGAAIGKNFTLVNNTKPAVTPLVDAGFTIGF